MSEGFPRGGIEPYAAPLFTDADPLMEAQVCKFGSYVIEFLPFEEESGRVHTARLSDELAHDESGTVAVRSQASRGFHLSAGAYGHPRADKKDFKEPGR